MPQSSIVFWCVVIVLISCFILLLLTLLQASGSSIGIDTDQYSIRSWDQEPERVRLQTVSALEAEWGSGYSSDYISINWHSRHSADTFYVMTERTGDFIGCVGMDNKQCYPFVSHLLVAPAQRSKGYASILLNRCEEHAANMGFTMIRLWCEPAMVPFYQNLGWETEQEMNGKTVFRKRL